MKLFPSFLLRKLDKDELDENEDEDLEEDDFEFREKTLEKISVFFL